MKYKGYLIEKIYEIICEKDMTCINHAYSIKEGKDKVDKELKEMGKN